MNLHEQLYQWTARSGLDARSASRLWALSGAGQPPADLWTLLRRGAGALAAALIGFGVILWVAANWDTLGRPTRFALLQALLIVSLAGAAAQPSWRRPLGLLAFLTLGGLLAFFGQTYQTGADVWTLFALWAGLSLPLALAVRSDLVWTPWTVVAGLAIFLWTQTASGHGWRFDRETLPVHAIGLCASVALNLALARRASVCGQPWAWRMSVVSATFLATWLGVGALFTRHVPPQYVMSLVVLAIAMGLAWWRREVYAMSVLALAMNILLVGRVAHRIPFNSLWDMLFTGLFAAALLAATVQLILRRVRAVEVQA
ncbi:Predicted membrane protein [Roseateles sp. YR242]|uniref:DUF2157 domain-containing protein n=1 Tax=Roseateles sp. YR242 TaxID=1855305 RepID=UPI0008C8E4EC|nr:DUF2157 domain-containing protein [Roseateles sp. YR242]SEL53226.1 Predicted membrane protein [Roseateles sp. YR242]